jgi:predicted Zn finger-like uncharacterized protein
MATEMKIKARCPKCSASYKVPSKAVGRQVKCLKCRSSFRVRETSSQLHPPTEDDILRWLNDALAEDERLDTRPWHGEEKPRQNLKPRKNPNNPGNENKPQKKSVMTERLPARESEPFEVVA